MVLSHSYLQKRDACVARLERTLFRRVSMEGRAASQHRLTTGCYCSALSVYVLSRRQLDSTNSAAAYGCSARVDYTSRTVRTRFLINCLTISIVTRLIIFSAGAAAVAIIGFERGKTLPQPTSENLVLNLPARWDTGWYIGVGHGGYRWNGRMDQMQNIAFFPAYPLLLRGTARLAQAGSDPVGWLWVGVALSTGLFAAALFFISSFVSRHCGPEFVIPAVWLTALFPFAIYFGLPYTESLFLLCVAGAFERLTSRSFLLAGVFAFAAGLARPNGWMLSLPLAVCSLALTGLVRDRRVTNPFVGNARVFAWLVALAPILGMAVYSVYIYRVTGRPFMWAEVQGAWGRYPANPLVRLAELWRPLWEVGLSGFWEQKWPDLIHFVVMVFALAAVFPVARLLGLAYGLLVLLGVVAPLIAGGVPSMGRYTSVLFPIFVWLAVACGPRWKLVAGVFFLGQLLVAALFFTWRPMF